SIIGGGQTMIIKWREGDNIGVVQRQIELSTDSGVTWQVIVTLNAPSSGAQQIYNWQVPGELSTQRGKLRLTVFDGAGNSASAISTGKFEVWAMPVITRVQYDFGVSGGEDQLEGIRRDFRNGDSGIMVNDRDLGKIRFQDRFNTGNGTCSRFFSVDKKLSKKLPAKTDVNIRVRTNTTEQISAGFSFKRDRPPGQ